MAWQTTRLRFTPQFRRWVVPLLHSLWSGAHSLEPGGSLGQGTCPATMTLTGKNRGWQGVQEHSGLPDRQCEPDTLITLGGGICIAQYTQVLLIPRHSRSPFKSPKIPCSLFFSSDKELLRPWLQAGPIPFFNKW